MRKHIKFSAEAIGPDFDKVKVVILEQTHREDNFGESSKYYSHGGITLCSAGSPNISVFPDRVYMRGYYKSYDANPIVMSNALYKKFKAAVLAYNKEFDAAPAPCAKPCAVIVG